jgi:hypothetical protein
VRHVLRQDPTVMAGEIRDLKPLRLPVSIADVTSGVISAHQYGLLAVDSLAAIRVLPFHYPHHLSVLGTYALHSLSYVETADTGAFKLFTEIRH